MTAGAYGYATWTSQPVVSVSYAASGGTTSEKLGTTWLLTIVELTVPAASIGAVKNTYVTANTGMWTGALPTAEGQSFASPGDSPAADTFECVQCTQNISSFSTPGTPYFDVVVVFRSFKQELSA